MRVAAICDTCATYINASCIIYNGSYLSSIGVSPLDSLDDILSDINSTFTAITGTGSPTTQVPKFVGQLYIDTNGFLWVGLSTSSINWGLVGTVTYTTTTTTTSTSSTTTTTTTLP